MANPLFGGQGFHWVLKASLPKSLDPRGNEEFIHVRLDYRDSDADGELLLSDYFLKINIAEAAAANASKAEVQPFKSKIAAMLWRRNMVIWMRVVGNAIEVTKPPAFRNGSQLYSIIPNSP